MVSRYSLFVISALLIPGLAQSAAIQATGSTVVCEIGNCASPGSLNDTGTIPTTPYSFVYTFANTDTFDVTGTYSAQGAATGPAMQFSATATYVGNSTHTASSADTLSVDFLEDFTSTSSLDGSYSSHATLTQTSVAPGSSTSGELFFGGQGIGLMGPYTGIGSEFATAGPTNLSGLGDSTEGDFRFTFVLAAGSPAIPEPRDIGLLGLGLFILAISTFRFKRAH